MRPPPPDRPVVAGWVVAVLPRALYRVRVEGGRDLIAHARSGDKGGDANLGLWVRHDGSPSYDARVAWLLATVTPEQRTVLHVRLPTASSD